MIVPMSKVEVLGPRRLLEQALNVLQSQGVLQLRPLPAPPRELVLSSVPLSPDQAERAKELRERVRRIRALRSRMPDGSRDQASGLPGPDSSEFGERLNQLEAELRALDQRLRDLQDEHDLIGRYERLLTALAPLRSAFEGPEVETIGLVLRRDRPEAVALLRREVAHLTKDRFQLISREIDSQQVGVLIALPKSDAPSVSRLLFERGVAEIKLPERYAGQPLIPALELLLRRTRELPDEIRGAEAAIGEFGQRWTAPLDRSRQQAEDAIEQLEALGRCGETVHAFVVAGWVPRRQIPSLDKALAAAFRGDVTVMEVAFSEDEYEAVPVVLDNPKWLRPFELLLSLVPLPRYGTLDPTIFLAIFFPLFFGFMLGDVGFGVVGLIAAVLVRWRRVGGEFARSASVVAMWSALSAVLFGLIFGEFFGDLGRPFGFHPWVLNRRTAALGFLGVALGLGGVHIVLGMVLGIYASARAHRTKEAFERGVKLALLMVAIAVIAALAGALPHALALPGVVAIGLLLVVAVVLGGVLAPLELVLSLGNILSYARLMALGMASVMLAEVANRMPELLHPAAVGVGMAVFLHAVNFALALLSPTVCALRLHYVEFFEKFYEGGGRPFRPLARVL